MEKQETKKTSSIAIIIEFIMFFTYAFFAVNWIAGSILTPQIMDYFNLKTFASATFISNAITLAKIVGNFLAAIILTKLFPKKAIGLGSGLIVLGSLIAILSPQYWLFILGRFIMGFGGALYIVYFSPVVIHYFSPEKRPAVNALNGVAYNFGGIIAMIVVGPVIVWLKTWQYSMAFFAVISALLFILWPIFGEDFELNHSGGKQNAQYTMGQAFKDKNNILLPLTYSGLLTFYIVLLNIFPISGVTSISGKTLSTLVAVGGIVGSLLAIILSKIFFKRLPVIRWSGLAMTLFGVLMFNTSIGILSAIAAFCIGIFMFLPVTSLMMIPQELPNMTPAKLTAIMGIFWALSYIIETVVYFIIGVVIDKFGYGMGLNLALIMSCTFFLGSFILPETGGKK
ncbi:MFS transporter [Clostridioides difficile]